MSARLSSLCRQCNPAPADLSSHDVLVFNRSVHRAQREGAQEVQPADGSDDVKRSAILNSSEAVLCAGPAGVQILSKAQLAGAKNLLIAATSTRFPPSGIEGLDMQANGDPLTPNGAVGLGPLAVGNVKYKTEFGLFKG